MKASDLFKRTRDTQEGTCFVIMPFHESMTAVYDHGIKPKIDSLGMVCTRADEIYSNQQILGDIWNSIQEAEVIIADCTGKNPNVMYELGLCHALWKKVILICQNKDDVPFDLKAWRVIWYDFTFTGAARLKDELGRAILSIKSEQNQEGQIVPYKNKGPSADGSSGTDSTEMDFNDAWHFGEVSTWRNDREFGFIRAEGTDFWFNEGYMAAPIEISAGNKVIFKALPALPNARNPRAGHILIEGQEINGTVTNTNK